MARSVGSEVWRDRYGPYALVTGASDGIGLATARELAAGGLNLLLVARREEVLRDVAAEIGAAHGVTVHVMPADLSDPLQVARVLNDAAAFDVGTFVAAAGFGSSGSFLDSDPAAEAAMVDVNCRAVLVMSRTLAARFAARKRGGIVLIGSIVAFQGVPNASNYAATKAYVQSLAEGLGGELAPLGIDVLACTPGPVSSGFAERAKMHMGASVDAATVARETVAALGRRASVRPGLLSKLSIGALSMLPRTGRTAIMGRIMTGMTKHQHTKS